MCLVTCAVNVIPKAKFCLSFCIVARCFLSLVLEPRCLPPCRYEKSGKPFKSWPSLYRLHIWHFMTHSGYTCTWSVFTFLSLTSWTFSHSCHIQQIKDVWLSFFCIIAPSMSHIISSMAKLRFKMLPAKKWLHPYILSLTWFSAVLARLVKSWNVLQSF